MPALDIADMAAAMIRRWWIVLLVPAIALTVLVVRDRALPYQSTVRASVVIPGDTEIPGSAEKPELMVMDDAPGLVTSRAFAEAVAAEMGSGATAGQVQSALSASRYSRLLSITASSDSSETAKSIATAAGKSLPAMINQYLVANAAKPATVQIIDPASDPTRSRPNARLLMLAETFVALVAGGFLAIVVEIAMRQRAITRAARLPRTE